MKPFLRENEDNIIRIVQHEVVPALGCTEPICVAFASAIARKHLEKQPEKIEVKVSANLMKNGMGVTVPGTGMVGLSIAAAIGAIGGDAEAGLEVLKAITVEQVAQAKHMLAGNKVVVNIAPTGHIFYAETNLYSGADWVRVCIEDSHTNVVRIEKNGEVVFSKPSKQTENKVTDLLKHVTARDIYDFALEVDLDKIRFIKQAADINDALSREGLNNDYGLHIARTLQKRIGSGLLSDDLLNRIVIESTAASDARMGGASLPAMSNSGSGNQGIAATMPVVTVVRHLGVDEEKLIRALFLSHAMAIYIHSKLPTLSALCAVTTASMGSAAAIGWLFTGKFETGSMAISNMIGDISGIICDGAANSCAMKVSTSVSSGYKSILLAMDDTRVSAVEGIVEEDIDRTISNLCSLARGSMQHIDHQIIEIMVQKP